MLLLLQILVSRLMYTQNGSMRLRRFRLVPRPQVSDVGRQSVMMINCVPLSAGLFIVIDTSDSTFPNNSHLHGFIICSPESVVRYKLDIPVINNVTSKRSLWLVQIPTLLPGAECPAHLRSTHQTTIRAQLLTWKILGINMTAGLKSEFVNLHSAEQLFIFSHHRSRYSPFVCLGCWLPLDYFIMRAMGELATPPGR